MAPLTDEMLIETICEALRRVVEAGEAGVAEVDDAATTLVEAGIKDEELQAVQNLARTGRPTGALWHQLSDKNVSLAAVTRWSYSFHVVVDPYLTRSCSCSTHRPRVRDLDAGDCSSYCRRSHNTS
jgi:hypothetical protein